MSVRSLSIAAAGLLVLLAGCSGGGDDKSATGGTEQGPAPTSSAPKYTQFDDFPGPALVFNDGNPVGARMKAVDTMWTPELADVPAESGKHYLAVYVALTPELADRGVKDVTLRGPVLRAKKTADDCTPGSAATSKGCVYAAYPTSQLDEVADGEWRGYQWEDTEIGGTDIERGQTLIGVLGFAIPDTVDAPAGFELCAPTKENYLFSPDFPCMPIPSPAEPRG